MSGSGTRRSSTRPTADGSRSARSPAPRRRPTAAIDGLIYLDDPSRSLRRCAKGSSGCATGRTERSGIRSTTLDGLNVVALKSIVPVLVDNGNSQLITSAADGMVGVDENNNLFRVSTAGACLPLLAGTSVSFDVRPAAVLTERISRCWRPTRPLHRTSSGSTRRPHLSTNRSRAVAHVAGALDGRTPQRSNPLLRRRDPGPEDYLTSWAPFEPNALTSPFKVPIPASVGKIDGGPTALDHDVMIPGTHAEVFVAEFLTCRDVLPRMPSSSGHRAALIRAGVGPQ